MEKFILSKDLENASIIFDSNNSPYAKTSLDYEHLTCNSNQMLTTYETCPELSEEASIAIFQLLEEWRFGFLYNLFLDERIDLEVLKNIKTHHLLSLCSNGKMKLGIAVQLEIKLRKWQITEATTILSNETSDKIDGKETIFYNICVLQILQNSPKGRLILNHFKSNNKLNDVCRASILDIINNHLIQNEMKMSTNLAKFISEQIVNEFPTEDISMYYIKQKGKPAISKVSAKFYNAQRSLKSCGILGKRSYESRFDKENKLRTDRSIHLESETNYQDNLQQIVNDNCSFAELEHLWAATKNFRALDVAVIQSNCSDIINKWPHYKKPLGHKLIDIDFKNLYPETKGISENFEYFSSKIHPILAAKIKDCHNKSILETLFTKNITENSKHICILYLLHNLLPPVTKAVSVLNNSKNITKFSIKDSQNSVFVFGETTTELEQIIDKKLEQKLPLQPFITILGTIEAPLQFLVYFDGIRYKLNTILDAIDCCFKIYTFFNLQYPMPSMLFWNFLQQYFYKINTNFDKYHPSISSLIQKLNN